MRYAPIVPKLLKLKTKRNSLSVKQILHLIFFCVGKSFFDVGGWHERLNIFFFLKEKRTESREPLSLSGWTDNERVKIPVGYNPYFQVIKKRNENCL